MGNDAFVDASGTKAAANNQDNGFLGVETIGAYSFVVGNSVFKQAFADGIACKNYFFAWKKSFESFVGHADDCGILGQQFVGDTRVRVLFLKQCGDAFGSSHLQRGAAGIAADAYSYVRTEIADNPLRHTLALGQTEEHGNVLQEVTAVETADGKPFDGVACGWDALHLHSVLGTDEEYFRVGTLCLDGIGNG